MQNKVQRFSFYSCWCKKTILQIGLEYSLFSRIIKIKHAIIIESENSPKREDSNKQITEADKSSKKKNNTKLITEADKSQKKKENNTI